MIRKTLVFILFFIHILVHDLSGQTSQVLYYMNLPQNHLMNPALRPSNSVYIGLPALSGINITVNNNFVNFSDLFMKDQSSDSIITFLHPDFNIDKFVGGLNDKNSFSPQASIQLLGLGFATANGGYFSLDINERVEGNIVLPGDLLKLLIRGNEGFAGGKINLSSLRCDMKYYREVGLGFSKSYNKLRLGVRGKLLFGIAGLSMDNNSLGITINDDYTHTLEADLSVNISAPLEVYMNDNNKIDSIVFDDSEFNSGTGVKKFFLGTENFGLGLDVGATYDISEKFNVSAAVTDLGYIKWKKDVTNLRANGQFEFSGLSMVDVLEGTKTFSEVGDEMLDSLKNAFTVTETENPFTTWLPVGVTLGGNYKLARNFSFGILSYSRIIGKQIREAFTLSANVNFASSFSTSLSYTLANQRADNLGLGIAFRTGIFQFYMLGDRIPLTWDRIRGNSTSLVLPSNWNMINIRLGMNLVFGNRISKKNDIPMVEVQ
jgi:hypothetical protein